jgi:hypothetical protein
MSGFSAKKYLIMAAISLALSLGIIRWHSVANISFCQFTAGCRYQDPKGTITTKIYGYPLAYKQTTSFRPLHNDEKKPDYEGYTETSIETLSFSVPSVLINSLFWFALLHLVGRLIRQKQIKAAQPN